jgi:hypothetical protein
MLMIENFGCRKDKFRETSTNINEKDRINTSRVCLTPFASNAIWNKIFSSRNISPIASDIFTLRYNHISTDCFLSERDDVVIQIIGHANNYSKISPYKRAQDESLIYGTLIDLYGEYDSDYKSFVICLDNSNFFNSVLEEMNESRAIFIFNHTEKPQNSIDIKEDSAYGELYNYRVQSKISFFDMFKNDITNTTNNAGLGNKIYINTTLFEALLDFKKMMDKYLIFNSSGAGTKDKHRFFNYYGTYNNNIYLSTVGVTNISELNIEELKLIDSVMSKGKLSSGYRNKLKQVLLRIKREMDSIKDTIRNLEEDCNINTGNCTRNKEIIENLNFWYDPLIQLYKFQPFNKEYDIMYNFDPNKHTPNRIGFNPDTINLPKQLNKELDIILDAIATKKNRDLDILKDDIKTKDDGINFDLDGDLIRFNIEETLDKRNYGVHKINKRTDRKLLNDFYLKYVTINNKLFTINDDLNKKIDDLTKKGEDSAQLQLKLKRSTFIKDDLGKLFQEFIDKIGDYGKVDLSIHIKRFESQIDKDVQKKIENELSGINKGLKTQEEDELIKRFRPLRKQVKDCEKNPKDKDCIPDEFNKKIIELNKFIFEKSDSLNDNKSLQELNGEIAKACTKKADFMIDTNDCIILTLKRMYQLKYTGFIIFIKKIIEYSVLYPNLNTELEKKVKIEEIIKINKENQIYNEKIFEGILALYQNKGGDLYKIIYDKLINDMGDAIIKPLLFIIFSEKLEELKKTKNFKIPNSGTPNQDEFDNIISQLTHLNTILGAIVNLSDLNISSLNINSTDQEIDGLLKIIEEKKSA